MSPGLKDVLRNAPPHSGIAVDLLHLNLIYSSMIVVSDDGNGVVALKSVRPCPVFFPLSLGEKHPSLKIQEFLPIVYGIRLDGGFHWQ